MAMPPVSKSAVPENLYAAPQAFMNDTFKASSRVASCHCRPGSQLFRILTFDSVENPSYATEFTTYTGTIIFSPSIGGTQEKEGARALLGFGDSRLVDTGFSPAGFGIRCPCQSIVGGWRARRFLSRRFQFVHRG